MSRTYKDSMGGDVHLVTNHKWRDVLCWYDLTPAEQADGGLEEQMDWIGFRYRGSVYRLNDHWDLSPGWLRKLGFQLVSVTSAFDGIALRTFDGEKYVGHERVVVAHIHW